MSLDSLIQQLINAPDEATRQTLVEPITAYGADAVQPLIGILGMFPDDDDYFEEGSDSELHSIAEDMLIAIGTPAVEALIPLLKSASWGERFGAILCLRDIGDPRAIQPMILSLIDGDVTATVDIGIAMEQFGDVALPYLMDALKHEQPTIRAGAVFAIRIFKHDDVKASLIELALHDPVYQVRENAVMSLNEFDDKDIIALLEQFAADPDNPLSELAQDLLDDRE